MNQQVAPIFPPGAGDHERHIISAQWHVEAAARWHIKAALLLVGSQRVAELVSEAFDASEATR